MPFMEFALGFFSLLQIFQGLGMLFAGGVQDPQIVIPGGNFRIQPQGFVEFLFG